MSQYATSAEFALIGLPPIALSGFTGDVDAHLTAASGVVDSYLRGRYRLPLSSPYPQEIIHVVCNLAAYSVLSIRGFDPTNGQDANYRMKYDDAMAWLERVAGGRVSLALEADATPTAHDGGPIVSSRSTRSTGGTSSSCYRDSFWGC